MIKIIPNANMTTFFIMGEKPMKSSDELNSAVILQVTQISAKTNLCC